MTNLTNIVNAKPITSLNVVSLPNGEFSYAGQVPVEIYYIDPTPEKIEAAKFGARFGPKRRTFETAQIAVDYATERGFEVNR